MAHHPVKVLSLNCNDLNNRIKSKRILSVLLKSRADIIFLQETHLRHSALLVFKSKWYPIQIQAHGTSKSRGMVVLISARLRVMVQDHIADPNSRFLFKNVHIEGEPFTLASLYVPNKKPLAFAAESLEALDSFCIGPIITGGDLNCLADGNLDYSGNRTVRNPVCRYGNTTHSFSWLLSQHHLQDVWRCHHPTEGD